MTTNWREISPPRISPRRFDFVVVPADVASVAFDFDLDGNTFTPFQVGTWIDTVWAPDVNRLVPGGHICRVAAPVAGHRCIHLILLASSALSAAPTSVQSLAATLVDTQDFVYHVTPDGDLYCVAERTEGLRHACYKFMQRNGVRELGPHPAYRIAAKTYLDERNISQVFRPLWPSIVWGADVGFSTTPGFPGQGDALRAWVDWFARNQQPRTFVNSSGDAGNIFNYWYQHDIRLDPTMAGYVPQFGVRGSFGGENYVSNWVDQNHRSGGPLCATHTGALTGALDAAGTGSTPWTPITTRHTPTGTPGTLDTVFVDVPTFHVIAMTGAGPITVQTDAPHGYTTGDRVSIGAYAPGAGGGSVIPNVTGMTSAIGRWNITVTGADTFTIPTTPNATYIAGGAVRNLTQCHTTPNANVWPIMLDFGYSAGAWSGAAKLQAEMTRDQICLGLGGRNDPRNPFTRIFTNEGDDGQAECACSKCQQAFANWTPYLPFLSTDDLAKKPAGEDREYHRQNVTASYINYWFGSMPVSKRPRTGLTAYIYHGNVPTIPLHPSLHVSIVYTSVLGSPHTPAELVQKWIDKPGGTRGISPVISFTRSGWDRPWVRVDEMMRTLFRRHSGSLIEFFNIGTFSTMQMGMWVYALSYLAWGDDDTDARIQEWFVLMFGPAANEVRKFYTDAWDIPPWEYFDRWDSRYNVSPQAIATSMVHANAAQSALTAAGGDSATQERLDYWFCYLIYLKNLFEFLNTQYIWSRDRSNSTKISAFRAAIEAHMMFLWRISLQDRVGRPHPNIVNGAQLAAEHTINFVETAGSSFADLATRWNWRVTSSAGIIAAQAAGFPSSAEVATAIAAATSAYSVLTAPVTQANYSDTLVPVTPGVSDTTTSRGPWGSGSFQIYRLIKPAGDVHFTVRQQNVGTVDQELSDLVVELMSKDGSASVLKWTYTSNLPVGIVDNDVFIPGSVPPGEYMFLVRSDGLTGNLHRVFIPRNVPAARVDALNVSREFDFTPSPITLIWMPVPLGVSAIYLQFESLFPVQFYQPDGVTAQTTTFTAPNLWSCAVPAGLDGRMWAFSGIQAASNQASIHSLIGPDLFAHDALQGLVPQGVAMR